MGVRYNHLKVLLYESNNACKAARIHKATQGVIGGLGGRGEENLGIPKEFPGFRGNSKTLFLY